MVESGQEVGSSLRVLGIMHFLAEKGTSLGRSGTGKLWTFVGAIFCLRLFLKAERSGIGEIPQRECGPESSSRSQNRHGYNKSVKNSLSRYDNKMFISRSC